MPGHQSQANKCFLCWTEIEKTKLTNNDDSHSAENSFMLINLLQVPHPEVYLERVNLQGQLISYCEDCSEKIGHVRGILEDLENLEKILIDEKYEIELQFKRQFPKDEANGFSLDNGDIGQKSSQDSNAVRVIRNDIVSDLRSSAIRSTLETLKKKRINGRIPSKPPDIPDSIRVMKNVAIPILETSNLISTTSTSLEKPISSNNHRNESERMSLRDICTTSVTGSKPISKGQAPLKTQTNPGSRTTHLAKLNTNSRTAIFYENQDNSEDGYENMLEIENDIDDDSDANPICSIMEQNFEEGFQPLEIPTSTFPSSLLIEEVFPESSHSRSFKLEDQGQVDPDPLSSCSENCFDSFNPNQNPLAFYCEECGANFDRADELEEHGKIHSEDFPVSNPHPMPMPLGRSWTAIRKTQLRNRKKITSQSQGRRRLAKPAKTSNSLKHKVKSKGQGKGFLCSECGKGFSSPRNLLVHMRFIHLGQFNLRCHICHQGCRGAADLRTHLESHSTDSNYSCPICSNGFKQKHNLRVHIRSFHPEHAATIIIASTPSANAKTKT